MNIKRIHHRNVIPVSCGGGILSTLSLILPWQAVNNFIISTHAFSISFVFIVIGVESYSGSWLPKIEVG